MYTLKRRKQGFDIPLDRWLRNRLGTFVKDILFDQKTLNRGYFRKGALRKFIDDYISGVRFYNGNQIFALLTLEMWHRTFIDDFIGC